MGPFLLGVEDEPHLRDKWHAAIVLRTFAHKFNGLVVALAEARDQRALASARARYPKQRYLSFPLEIAQSSESSGIQAVVRLFRSKLFLPDNPRLRHSCSHLDNFSQEWCHVAHLPTRFDDEIQEFAAVLTMAPDNAWFLLKLAVSRSFVAIPFRPTHLPDSLIVWRLAKNDVKNRREPGTPRAFDHILLGHKGLLRCDAKIVLAIIQQIDIYNQFSHFVIPLSGCITKPKKPVPKSTDSLL